MPSKRNDASAYVFTYMAALEAERQKEFARILAESREVQVEDCKEANELIAKIKSNLKRLGK